LSAKILVEHPSIPAIPTYRRSRQILQGPELTHFVRSARNPLVAASQRLWSSQDGPAQRPKTFGKAECGVEHGVNKHRLNRPSNGVLALEAATIETGRRKSQGNDN
jgi:hypothetical protein